MVHSSPISEPQEKQRSATAQAWLQRAPLIAGTVIATVLLMVVSLHVKAMLTPEDQKTMEQLYDLKTQNGVSLRSLNEQKVQQELALSQTKTSIAEVEEHNARIDVCITKLQNGVETTDDKCDPATLTVSANETGTGSSVSSVSSSQGF